MCDIVPYTISSFSSQRNVSNYTYNSKIKKKVSTKNICCRDTPHPIFTRENGRPNGTGPGTRRKNF